jgi:hypothetical protein
MADALFPEPERVLPPLLHGWPADLARLAPSPPHGLRMTYLGEDGEYLVIFGHPPRDEAVDTIVAADLGPSHEEIQADLRYTMARIIRAPGHADPCAHVGCPDCCDACNWELSWADPDKIPLGERLLVVIFHAGRW